MNKGDIITDGTYYRLVLETLGDLVFTSDYYKLDWNGEDILEAKNTFDECQLKEELLSWAVVVPEWNPKDMKIEDNYWFTDEWGDIKCCFFKNDQYDKWRIATNNCFRSEADAINYKKKVLGE